MEVRNQKIRDFKKEVLKELIKRIGNKEASRLMREYESDFQFFYEIQLSVVATATAIIMGY